MSGFIGFVTLGSTLTDGILVTNSSGTPVNTDAVPTYNIYSSSARLLSASTAAYHTFTVTGVGSGGGLVQVTTTPAHGLATGQYVTVSGTTGTGDVTDANGTYTITVTGATTYTIDGSTWGSGTFSGNGTGFVTGFYKAAPACTTGNGFAASENYRIVYNYAVSSSAQSQVHEFMVA